MLWDDDDSNHDQGCLETVTWCGTHPCTQESAPIPLSALFSQRSASDGSERTAVTFRFGRFLFFFSPSSLLPSMHPSSFEGTRGRVRARAGHDRRTNSDDRHLLFLSPGLGSSFSSYFPSESRRLLGIRNFQIERQCLAILNAVKIGRVQK